MIRLATIDDQPAILTICDNAGAERLSDPRAFTAALARRLIVAGAVWVWRADSEPIAGLAAIDAAAGEIMALLVAPGQQGRGIGRALLAHACDALRDAGRTTATIVLETGTAAERHYRAAGWNHIGAGPDGSAVLRKSL